MREALAVGEQAVEVAAVGLQVVGVEDRPEDPLHVLDVLADADRRAGLRLDVGRAGQVVGMGVGLQHPDDIVALGLRGREDGVDRANVDRAGLGVVVEHGVDDGGLPRGGIPHQIGDGVGRSSKKA